MRQSNHPPSRCAIRGCRVTFSTAQTLYSYAFASLTITPNKPGIGGVSVVEHVVALRVISPSPTIASCRLMSERSCRSSGYECGARRHSSHTRRARRFRGRLCAIGGRFSPPSHQLNRRSGGVLRRSVRWKRVAASRL